MLIPKSGEKASRVFFRVAFLDQPIITRVLGVILMGHVPMSKSMMILDDGEMKIKNA